MPAKKKASGDPAKAKRFSRTCALFPTHFLLTLSDQLLAVSVDPTLHLERVSLTHLPSHPRPHGNGLLQTWIDGSPNHLPSLQEMLWLSPASLLLRTELT